MISVFFVVRNEAHRILESIKKVRPLVDEVVVVDQDSEDDTRRIATHMADRVAGDRNRGYAEPSRQYAESLTTGDWVLFLDADEYVQSDDENAIRNLVQNATVDGFTLRRITKIYDDEDPSKWTQIADEAKYRLFKRGYATYFPTVHSDPTPTGRVADSGLVIMHEKTWSEQLLDNEHHGNAA